MKNVIIEELNPKLNSYLLAKTTFLPEYDDSSFSGYKTLDNDYNFKNCDDFPHSSCPTGARCEACPFNVRKYKVVACTSPYIKSGDTCACPAATPVIYPNDVCTKYCGNTCIAKTCTPTVNKTTCTNGFRNCDNGCGQNTRKCCNPCSHKITSKPGNSSYTYSSCTDDDGNKQIQTGWKCNSGYHEKNGQCEKDCIATNCSGYTLTSCPANGNCSKCTVTASNCSTGDTKYKLDSCNNGYQKQGNCCVIGCPEGFTFDGSRCYKNYSSFTLEAIRDESYYSLRYYGTCACSSGDKKELYYTQGNATGFDGLVGLNAQCTDFCRDKKHYLSFGEENKYLKNFTINSLKDLSYWSGIRFEAMCVCNNGSQNKFTYGKSYGDFIEGYYQIQNDCASFCN